jgi:hypothetical protein
MTRDKAREILTMLDGLAQIAHPGTTEQGWIALKYSCTPARAASMIRQARKLLDLDDPPPAQVPAASAASAAPAASAVPAPIVVTFAHPDHRDQPIRIGYRSPNMAQLGIWGQIQGGWFPVALEQRQAPACLRCDHWTAHPRAFHDGAPRLPWIFDCGDCAVTCSQRRGWQECDRYQARSTPAELVAALRRDMGEG